MEFSIRPLCSEEYPMLEDFLYEAVFQDKSAPPLRLVCYLFISYEHVKRVFFPKFDNFIVSSLISMLE